MTERMGRYLRIVKVRGRIRPARGTRQVAGATVAGDERRPGGISPGAGSEARP